MNGEEALLTLHPVCNIYFQYIITLSVYVHDTVNSFLLVNVFLHYHCQVCQINDVDPQVIHSSPFH